MDDEANPAANPELHARAEEAALEAFKAAADASPASRVRRMDRAAAKVFEEAGTPRAMVELFSESVTALVLGREERESGNRP